MSLLRQARSGARVPRFDRGSTGLGARGRSYADIGMDEGASAAVGEFLSDWGRRVLGDAAAEREQGRIDTANRQGVAAGGALARTVGDQLAQAGPGDSLSIPALPLLRNNTPEGDAYDHAVGTAYLTSLDVMAEDFAQRVAGEHPDDPQAFRARWDAAGQALVGQLPVEMQAGASAEWMRKGLRHMAPIAEAGRQKLLAETNATLMSAADQYQTRALNAWRSGDQTAIGEWDAKFRETVAARTDLDARQKTRLVDAYQDAARAQNVLGHFDRHLALEGPRAARAFISSMLKPEAHPDWDISNRERIANVMEARVRDVETAQREAADAAEQVAANRRARWLSDFDIQLSRGQVGYEAVEAAYARGWLKPHERASAVEKIDRTIRDRMEQEGDSLRVGAAVAGVGTLDPRSDRDRKAVSAHYAGLAAGWRDLPEGDQVERMVQAATRYGMVPEPVKAGLRGALRRADQPAMVVQAADVVERLRHANPALLNDFSQDDLSLGNLVGTYAGAGLPPAEAVRLATEAAKVPEAERTARKAAFADMRKDTPSASADFVRAQLVGGWFARHLPGSGVPNAAPPPELVAEFDRVAEAEFTRHGNLDAARKTATDAVRRVWGLSSIGGLSPDGSGASGGARLMRQPPELFYGRAGLDPETNGAWMREQLAADLRKSGTMGDAHADELESRFMLAADPTRTDPATGGPLYQVWLKSHDGRLETVRGADQRPLLWRPDWAASPAAERQRQGIDALRTYRSVMSADGHDANLARAFIDAANPMKGGY